jgi:serine phosphatase RsbU (regulator of sigma subunit)
LILLSTGFIVYTLIRRRVMKMQAQHEQLENELRIARDIQMSMVPSTFPDLEGLDMYAQMTPAKEVGGDLYGYVLSGSKLYFAVGDVSGKGVPASLFMAQATRLFRTLATQGMMPAEICTRINDALSGDDNQSGMFVTLFLGLLDLTTGHLDFCNAGHNPPAITTANCQSSSQRHTLKERIVNYQFLEVLPNAPIGLWPELQYEGESLPTIMGKKLLIYTDGLNEAENRQQQQFGDDHLLDILRTTPFENARQLIDTLSAAVDSHRDGAEPNDDLTMMCISLPGQA